MTDEPNELDDLLRPSLTSDDDASGFSQPWNPSTIVMLSFIFGSIAGASLLGLNAKRLGMRDTLWRYLVGGLIFTVALYAIVIFLIIPSLRATVPGLEKSAAKFIRIGAVTLAAWLVSAGQRQRYRLAQVTDVPLGNLWGPGTVACVVGVIVESVIALGMAIVFVFITQ